MTNNRELEKVSMTDKKLDLTENSDKAPRPKRILIGFDGSNGAEDALALARVLTPEASAVLAYVLPHEDPIERHYELLGYEGSPAAEGFFDEAIAALDGHETEVRTYVGASPAHVLCDLAEDTEFDLVIVGSPHRGTLGRALIGSVAEALLHGARVPIVLAPRDYAKEFHDSLQAIAVAYDGTAESGRALRLAESLALANGASLEVLTVVGPSAVVPKVLVKSRDPVEEPYAVIEKAIDEIDDALEVHAHMLIGPVAETVAHACKDADLLVTGSRDYGPLERVLVGSIASRLVHTAPCPVLVVPRPA
jgi:nucleotide-binding universal stress UspA family protein